MVRRMKHLALAVLAALASASMACGGAEVARDVSSGDSSELVPPPVTTLIALDGDGLMLVDRSGSTRAVAFGTPEAQLLSAATAALGGSSDRTSNVECGAGPLEFVSFAGGLTVNLQAAKFVAWSVRTAGGQQLRTMSGIGLGSTRAELEGVYAAKVVTSSLGVEFSAGGLAGVLASKAATAPITHLWAGANCIAR